MRRLLLVVALAASLGPLEDVRCAGCNVPCADRTPPGLEAPLSTAKTERGYGGLDIARLYDWYSEKSGWWNDDGDFTIEDFIGMVLVRERYKHLPATDPIVEATARQLWSDARPAGGHGPYCLTDSCFNGVFNFLAAYSQSAHVMFRQMLKGQTASKPEWQVIQSVMDDARYMGFYVLHPKPEWTVYSNDAVYGWGNSRTWGDMLRARGVSQGFGSTQRDRVVFWDADGDFILFTMNQQYGAGFPPVTGLEP